MTDPTPPMSSHGPSPTTGPPKEAIEHYYIVHVCCILLVDCLAVQVALN